MTERREIPTGRLTDETTPPVESATVMLLRDAPSGDLEVLMLERHVESDFAGGALVFPGGKVEAADRKLPEERWRGLDVAAVSEPMAAPADLTLGWHVAAVRESFEEASVLLALRGGHPVTAADLTEPTFTRARERLASRDDRWDWRRWLAEQDLVLDLGALTWWSWWVTPPGLQRRYETRFFVAPVPEGQAGTHDAVETTSLRWTSPAAALAAGHRGEATVVYPTRKNLESLDRFPSVDGAIAAARSGAVDRRRTVPALVEVGGEVRIRHPFTGEVEPP